MKLLLQARIRGWTDSLAVQPFDIPHEYASGLLASECPSRPSRLSCFFSACLAPQAELTFEFTHCYGGHMLLPNWRIGRALGIPIHVHASWFVVFFFVTWSLATGYLPETLPGLSAPRYWGMGGIAALLLF